MTGIPTPEGESTLFYGYKEPLRRFEKGFGYQGVLSYSNDYDRVQCHLCGKLFKHLGVHVAFSHKMNAASYKKTTGLSNTSALVGEGTRAKFIHNRNENPIFSKKHHKKMLEAVREARLLRKSKNIKILKSLEQKNKEGTCPDQLLDLIRKTADSYGRTPSSTEFKKMHRGRYMRSIEYTFGSWGEAIKKLKMQPKYRGFTDEQLLESLKTFYRIHKRTPSLSDAKRGLIYGYHVYLRRFGSMNRARLLANVPFIIRVGSHVEEWMPNKKERELMLSRNKV